MKSFFYALAAGLIFSTCSQKTERILEPLPLSDGKIYHPCGEFVIEMPLSQLRRYEYSKVADERNTAQYVFFMDDDLKEIIMISIANSTDYEYSSPSKIREIIQLKLPKHGCEETADTARKFREWQLGNKILSTVEYCERMHGYCRMDSTSHMQLLINHKITELDSIFISSIRIRDNTEVKGTMVE